MSSIRRVGESMFGQWRRVGGGTIGPQTPGPGGNVVQPQLRREATVWEFTTVQEEASGISEEKELD